MRRILLVSLAAGVLTGCGSDGARPTPAPSPQPSENHAPQLRGVSISPPVGVAGISTFTLHADATDLDGDPLSYAWKGWRTSDSTEQSIGSTAYISFVAGDVVGPIHVKVTDGKGGSTSSDIPYLVTAKLTGGFDGYFDGPSHGQDFSMQLEQVGSRVTGTFYDYRHWESPNESWTWVSDPAAPGTIDATGAFRIRFKHRSTPDVVFVGTLSPGNEVTEWGYYSAYGHIEGGDFNDHSFAFGEHNSY